jgi:hypothetical protein
MGRFIGPNTHQPEMPHSVTLSRSEGSLSLGLEMLPCPQHDHAPLNIFLLYNIRSFLEEIEFSTERERAYEKNVENAPEEWYYIVTAKTNQRVQNSEVNYDIQHTSVGG